jgi:hypothetical protein
MVNVFIVFKRGWRLKYFKGRRELKSSNRSKVHKEEPWFISQKLSRRNKLSKFSVGNLRSREDHGIPVRLQEG